MTGNWLSRLEDGVGLDIVLWFYRFGSDLPGIFHTYPGYLILEYGVLVLLPVLYWSVDRLLGRRLFLLILTTHFLAVTLKYLWMRPRPYQKYPELFNPGHPSAEPGLPSGHTIFGTVAGLTLGAAARRKPWTVFWYFFIAAMGLSRLIAGVHYPQDVLAGWVLGLLGYVVFGRIIDMAAAAGARMSLMPRLGITLLTAVAAAALVMIFAGNPDASKSLMLVIGALAGGVVGFQLEAKYLVFNTSDITMSVRVLRSLTGLLSLAMIYFATHFVFYALVGDNTGLEFLILYGFRYALIGLWVTLGVPWLFGFFPRMDSSHGKAIN